MCCAVVKCIHYWKFVNITRTGAKMRRFRALIKKEIIHMLRDPRTLVFLFFHKDGKISDLFGPFEELARRAREIISFFISAVFAWFLAQFFKYIIAHPRPYDAFTNIHPLITETGSSFPSGHATFFAALATSVYLYHKRAGIVLWICALAIGFARILAGVHFPVDILGGYALGILIAILFHKMFMVRNIEQKNA